MKQRGGFVSDSDCNSDVMKPFCFQSKLSELITYFFVYDTNSKDYMLKVIERPEYLDFFKDEEFTEKIDKCYKLLYPSPDTNNIDIVNNDVEKYNKSIIYNIDVYYQFIRLIEKLIKTTTDEIREYRILKNKEKSENSEDKEKSENSEDKEKSENSEDKEKEKHIQVYYFDDILNIYEFIINCSIYSNLCDTYDKVPQNAINFNKEIHDKLDEINDVRIMTLELIKYMKSKIGVKEDIKQELIKTINKHNVKIIKYKEDNCIFQNQFAETFNVVHGEKPSASPQIGANIGGKKRRTVKIISKRKAKRTRGKKAGKQTRGKKSTTKTAKKMRS